MKKCPYCAEKIQGDALVCKHCGRSLVAQASASPGDQIGQPPQPVIQVVQQVKRSHAGCWIGLGVLIAILIIFLVFLKACADVVSPTPAVKMDPVALTVQASNAATAQAGGQPVQPKTVAPTEVPVRPTKYVVGDIVKLGGLQVTLNEVKEVPGTNFFTPEDGKYFLVVDMTFENIGNKDEVISSMLNFKLKDSTGQAYSISISATVASEGKAPDGTIPPGDKLRGQIGYELPLTAKGLVLTFEPGLISSSRVQFDLGR